MAGFALNRHALSRRLIPLVPVPARVVAGSADSLDSGNGPVANLPHASMRFFWSGDSNRDS